MKSVESGKKIGQEILANLWLYLLLGCTYSSLVNCNIPRSKRLWCNACNHSGCFCHKSQTDERPIDNISLLDFVYIFTDFCWMFATILKICIEKNKIRTWMLFVDCVVCACCVNVILLKPSIMPTLLQVKQNVWKQKF